MIARGSIDKALEMHWHYKADAYMKQAKITYSGIPRQFSQKNGKESIMINRQVEGGMENDIGSLETQRVILVPSQQGVDVRISNRSMYF